MKWITRQNIKVDRDACPWLIRRFIDAQAQFLFVDQSQLLETAAREDAIPFDAPRLSEVKLNHRGVRCSFEAIIEVYTLRETGSYCGIPVSLSKCTAGRTIKSKDASNVVVDEGRSMILQCTLANRLVFEREILAQHGQRA